MDGLIVGDNLQRTASKEPITYPVNKVECNWRHMFLDRTHLSSWLYLAKRSDRQGAPVLIWEKNEMKYKTQSATLKRHLVYSLKSPL